jgi:hypothetical protein
METTHTFHIHKLTYKLKRNWHNNYIYWDSNPLTQFFLTNSHEFVHFYNSIQKLISHIIVKEIMCSHIDKYGCGKGFRPSCESSSSKWERWAASGKHERGWRWKPQYCTPTREEEHGRKWPEWDSTSHLWLTTSDGPQTIQQWALRPRYEMIFRASADWCWECNLSSELLLDQNG